MARINRNSHGLAEVLVTLLHRLLYLGCLVAVLSPLSKAQTPSKSETSNLLPGGWLGKEEPRAVAWRAHNAMVTDDGSVIPELLSLAGRWQRFPFGDWARPELSPEQKEERDAMAVVLDALIQLHAPIPAETLRNLAPDFENAVAVVLARMPIEESGPLSLEFYRSPPMADYPLQSVSAALLALHPRAGFAAKLLSDITVRATVFAILPGGERYGEGSGGSYFNPTEPTRDDWPMIGQYKLSTEMSEGAAVLVAGVEPIYVSRVESNRYLGSDHGMSLGMYLSSEKRRGLIAEMLGVPPEEIPWETRPQLDIECESPEELGGQLLGFIEEQQQMYRASAAALQEHKLLAPSDAEPSLPLLVIDLSDARGEDAEPFAKDSIHLPARVAWSN